MSIRNRSKKIGLKIQLIGPISIIILIGVSLTSFLSYRKINGILKDDLERRGQMLTRILANNSVFGVIFSDMDEIEKGIKGIKNESDILFFSISDNETQLYTYQKEGVDLQQMKTGEKFFSDINNEGEKIGQVQLYLSRDRLDKVASGIKLSALLNGLIQVVLSSIMASIFLQRIIITKLNSLKEKFLELEKGGGDLTARLESDSSAELEELTSSFNNFLDTLHDIIKQVRRNTDEVASAANEISSTSANLALGTEKQTSLTTEASASVQEMSAAIHENSQNAVHTAEIAKQAKDKAHEGAEAMQGTRQGMEEIVVAAEKTDQIVDSLSKRADQIGDIIQVIDDIADQTNLLALNAAIEAARAGEQGRGFAVVADEVRKLAERTTKATGKIAETIRAIQGDTEQASKSMSEANEMVNKGKDAVTRTENVLGEIVSAVTQAMDMIGQIATATEEMSSGAEQISQNVASISAVTTESATGAGQMAATAEQLTKQTKSLWNLVNKFKLRENGSKSSVTAAHNGGLSEVVVSVGGEMKGRRAEVGVKRMEHGA